MAYARLLPIVFVLAAALTGCGGGDGSSKDPTDVIEKWSAALRAGDGVRAAQYFTVPAIVQNNTPPIKLKTRAEIVFFNMTLPCGGKIVSTSQRGRYIDVVFELTDRPGGNCGTGTGHLVENAFLVRDGKIAEWRRLADPDEGPVVVTGPKA